VTVKERINELLEAARKADAAGTERADLVEQARRLCREHKIGMGAFDWPDAETVDTDARVEDTPAAEEPTAGAPRSIGEMVERLLMDPSLNYVEIASRVRAQFAHAPTAAWPRSPRRCGRGEWASRDGGGLRRPKQTKGGECGRPEYPRCLIGLPRQGSVLACARARGPLVLIRAPDASSAAPTALCRDP
jgi:hypothetical protein